MSLQTERQAKELSLSSQHGMHRHPQGAKPLVPWLSFETRLHDTFNNLWGSSLLFQRSFTTRMGSWGHTVIRAGRQGMSFVSNVQEKSLETNKMALEVKVLDRQTCWPGFAAWDPWRKDVTSSCVVYYRPTPTHPQRGRGVKRVHLICTCVISTMRNWGQRWFSEQ